MPEQSSVTITCKVTPEKYGNLYPNMRPLWKVTKGSFPVGVSASSGVLSIRVVTVESELNYTCTIGNLEAFVKITINGMHDTLRSLR